MENQLGFQTNLGRENWNSWFPWVWTSDQKFSGAGIDAWSEYFKFPTEQEFVSPERTIRGNNISREDLIISEFPLLTHALRQTFTFSDSCRLEIGKFVDEKYISNDHFDDYISVHIRRGENVSSDEKWMREGIPFFSLQSYADAAKDLAYELGINKLFVSTDSISSLEKFSELCRDFEIFSNRIDRSQFFRPESGQIEDVETYIRKNPSMCSFYAFTALADLHMLSQSRGIVGTISVSEFSKTAWYLAVAKSNFLVPFRSLSGPLDIEAKDGFYMV